MRIGPLHFQAGCHKRQLNLALVFWCYFCDFGILCVLVFLGYFYFMLSVPVQLIEQLIAWKDHPQNDLLCVEWMLSTCSRTHPLSPMHDLFSLSLLLFWLLMSLFVFVSERSEWKESSGECKHVYAVTRQAGMWSDWRKYHSCPSRWDNRTASTWWWPGVRFVLGYIALTNPVTRRILRTSMC